MKALIFKYDDFKKSSKKALNDAYMSGKPIAKLELKKNKKAINLFLKNKNPQRDAQRRSRKNII